MDRSHGPVLARITSLVVFVPGQKPVRYEEKQILAAGMQGGTSVAAVKNEDGTQSEYYGLPLKITKAPSAGLVAPPSGGLVLPPT